MNAAEPYQELANQRNKNNRRNGLGNRPNKRVVPTELPEYVANFKEIIKRVINNKVPNQDFDKLLIENGALVAGGSVLAASQGPNTKINDFDIYVPMEKAFSFFAQFVNFLFTIYGKEYSFIEYSKFASSFYCNSFLRRNGIKQVHRFHVMDPHSNKKEDALAVFDIMTVRKIRKPIDVVNNFDLTFCQTWYDGKTIWTSHPEDIRSKKGKLQGDYRKLFINGNKFIHKRVKKYIDKGFGVSLDDFTAEEIKDSFFFNKELCPNPVENPKTYSGWLEDGYMNKWAIRALKKSFLGNQYLSTITFNNPTKYRKLYPEKTKFWEDTLGQRRIYSHFKIDDDDGYDTDEFVDESKLVALADTKYKSYDEIELSTSLTPELKFHRMANYILQDSIYPFAEDDTKPGDNFSILIYGRVHPFKGDAQLIYGSMVRHVCSNYYNELKRTSLRVASKDYLFASEGDIVYDLHNHPMEGAINKEYLQAHLEANSEIENKNRIPCYWKPEPGDSSKNCKKHLTLRQIFYCVDYNFFFKFRKFKGRENESLVLNIPKYDQILYDTKEGPPQDPSWPNLYHEGVCPFCLESVSREAGCIYMTHANPQGLPDSESPFCNPSLVFTDMLEYYRNEGRRVDPHYIPNVQDHLEFCIECGRPSYNHRHFSYENSEKLIGGDASVCKGLGRAELFARVLEIRESFSDGDDRKKAAARANNVFNDSERINEASILLTVTSHAEGDRNWGNSVKFQEGGRKKRYTKTRKTKRSTK